MEQDPAIVLSCVLGTIGISHPFQAKFLSSCPNAGIFMPPLLGDGGKQAERESSTYAYRIKYLYPNAEPPKN
eukprot:6177097-Pleurochrysis_carterae.AAC.4